jgi:hypothetical protein
MRILSSVVVSLSLTAFAIAQPASQIERRPVGPGSAQEQPVRPGMPPRDLRAPQTGTAQIKGRVLAADTASPLRKVQVRVFAPQLRSPRLATTDAEGRFEFRDLPAGRYNVSATKPGYVSLQYGQRRPFEQGRPIELADGQVVDKINFSLPRGGVISGRIVDEFGEPIADAMVAAMQLRYAGGRRRPVPAGRTSPTNDLGQFRVWGLPPGEYLVSATLRAPMLVSAESLVGVSQGDNTGYAPTFFPGTGSVAEAQRVAVTLGAETGGVEFPLLPVRTARLSGVVVDSEGRPYTEGTVNLMQSPESGMVMMFGGGVGRLGPDGAFTLANVTPGEYTLQARVRRSKTGDAPMPEFVAPSEGETAILPVTVSGEDIIGIVMVATKGAKLSGRVVFDGAAPAQSLENLRIIANTASGDVMPMMGGFPARVGIDGAFELMGLIGRRTLRAVGAPGWYLKSVRVDGREMIDTPIDFKGTESLSSVEVVLTNRAAQLTGSVTTDGGQPVKDFTVVVFPEDKALWTPDSRFFGTGRPDQDGRFKVMGLPGETYLVAALEYADPGEVRDPEYLEKLRAAATRVSVGEGEMKSLELKLVQVP